MADGVVVSLKNTLKLFLYSLLMILGFTSALIGPMIMFLPHGMGSYSIGLTVLIVGALVGLVSLFRIIALNADYHEAALKKALENPKRILFHFHDIYTFKEIIITKDAIFYNGTFMNLKGAQSLKYGSFEEGELRLGIYNSAGRYSSLHEYSTFPPEDLYEGLQKWLDRFGLPKTRPLRPVGSRGFV